MGTNVTDYDFTINEPVIHKKYGEGVIVAIDKYITVDFCYDGEKKFLLNAFDKGYLYHREGSLKKYLVTDDWIYSLYLYYPTAYQNCGWVLREKDQRISEEILKYKNGVESTVRKFTDELYDAVLSIIGNLFSSGPVWLIAVPSSQASKKPQAAKSVTDIAFRYCDEHTDRWVLDKTAHLYRKTSIMSAHLSNKRPSIQTQKETMLFDVEYVHKDVSIILIDDVVTVGTTMTACRELLMDAGVSKDNIKGLTIGKTVPREIMKTYVE